MRKVLILLALVICSVVGAQTAKNIKEHIIVPMLTVDNLRLDGNTISSLDSDGDINIVPDGTGTVNIPADISTTGTVDGRDISQDGSALDTLTSVLGDITEEEANQIENIGSNSITSTIWGYLAELDQSISTMADALFGSVKTSSTTEASRFNPMTTLQRDALTPTAGDLVFNTDTNSYNFYDGTAWSEVGTGSGSGTKNYLSQKNSEVENNEGDWAEFDDSSGFVDGTGGTPSNITLSHTTNSAVVPNGSGAIRLTKDVNGSCVGEGISVTTETIDLNDRGKALKGSMSIRVANNTASGDYQIHAYDVTNSVALPVVSGDSQNDIPAMNGTLDFQVITSTTTEEIRLAILCNNATGTTGLDLYIDNIRLGPDSSVPGTYAYNIGNETWTDSEANATTSVNITRYGNRIIVDGVTTVTGTFSGSEFAITIPSQYTRDSNIYGSTAHPVGKSKFLDSGSVTAEGLSLLSTTTLILRPLSASGTYATGTAVTSSAPHTWANGDAINFNASWVVSGWQASASISTTESFYRKVHVSAYNDSAQSIGNNSSTKVTLSNAETDEFGMFDAANSRIIIKYTDWYVVRGRVNYAQFGASGENQAEIRKNGTTSLSLGFGNATNSGRSGAETSKRVFLQKGDFIELYTRQTSGGSVNTRTGPTDVFLQVTRDPDLSKFSVYGEFQVLSSTSSAKTPSATGNFSQMTNSSLPTTPGTWRLFGSCDYLNGGSSPEYTSVGSGWFAANGADTSSIPSSLTTITGLSIISAIDSTQTRTHSGNFSASAQIRNFPAPSLIVRVSQPTTIYLVPNASMTTAANARITCYPNAERLQ